MEIEVSRDAAWLLGFVKPKLLVRGFVIIVIREPKLHVEVTEKRC
jgi:hypothetical protein